MQNLGVTMSYTVVQGVIKKLGENHDSKVREWCEKMRLAKFNNVSYSYSIQGSTIIEYDIY